MQDFFSKFFSFSPTKNLSNELSHAFPHGFHSSRNYSFFSDEIPDTTSRTIELSDKRQIKKSPKTLILAACNLSDFQIICISSVCSDLRFYDYSTVDKCNLRFYIRSFPSPIVAIHFHCFNDSGKNSKLIFGDMVGSVRVIDFMKNFKFRHGSMMRQVSYQELMKVAMIDVWSV